MYPVVLSFIPFSCWRAFPKVGKARIFYGAGPWASGQKKVSELLAQLPSQAQMDELLKEVKYLEQMAEQAGKQKEKRFSLPRISLPSLEFPHLSPALLLIPVVLFVLWTMWYSWDALWSVISTLGQ